MSVPASYRAPWDLAALLAESPFLAGLGLRFVHLGSDGARFELDPGPGHLNAEGRLHGGAIASLLDAACGLPARVVGEGQDLVRAVTVSLSVDYLAAPRGPRVTATGRLVGGGRTLVFARGEVLDADGTPVAQAIGTFKRLSPARPGQPSETAE
ncbi:PaaI family thioesterase [Frigidibacter sp. MR17.24]|uniref:PaaI family thioesterase n=1 Tax=Frigidibacter sp. MR17.24 TaxID=3127345 RepID=UPI003012E9FE